MDIASYQGTEITQLQISQPLNIEHSTKQKKIPQIYLLKLFDDGI